MLSDTGTAQATVLVSFLSEQQRSYELDGSCFTHNMWNVEMEEQEVENARIELKNYIERLPQESDFEYQDDYTIKLPQVLPGSGALLVKNLYLLCESYMRGRMQNLGGSHNHPFIPGSRIEGYGVFRVEDSDNPEFKPGDVAVRVTRWEEYSLLETTNQLRKIEREDIPLSYYLGLLGQAGFTAWKVQISYIS
ncbi:hypothetical protein QQ045_027993 [Rhodiola kirilowii]